MQKLIKEANKKRGEIWRYHGFQDNPQGKHEKLLEERLNKRKDPIYLPYSEAAARDRADLDARIQRATMKANEKLAADALANLEYNFEQIAKRRRKFGKKKKVSRKKSPSATLKKLCKKLGVRLTTKRGYKSEKVLKKQCKNKMK